MLGEFEVDVTVEEDVDLIAPSARADVFIAQVGVRDFALVENVANPADGVGVGPGDPEADAGSLGGVARDVGCQATLTKLRPSSFETARMLLERPPCTGRIQDPAGNSLLPDLKACSAISILYFARR